MNPDKIRNVLNILFMILAVATVIIYLVSDNLNLFIIVGSTAIFLKVMEFLIRFINR